MLILVGDCKAGGRSYTAAAMENTVVTPGAYSKAVNPRLEMLSIHIAQPIAIATRQKQPKHELVNEGTKCDISVQ